MHNFNKSFIIAFSGLSLALKGKQNAVYLKNNLVIRNMGETWIKLHANSEKHKQNFLFTFRHLILIVHNVTRGQSVKLEFRSGCHSYIDNMY